MTNLHECISPLRSSNSSSSLLIFPLFSPFLRSRQPVCPVIWGLLLPRLTKISKIFSLKSVETISSRGQRGQSPGCLAGPALARMNTGEPNCGGVGHLWPALSRPLGTRARIPLPCLPLAPQWLNGRQVAGPPQPLACLQGDTTPPILLLVMNRKFEQCSHNTPVPPPCGIQTLGKGKTALIPSAGVIPCDRSRLS